jgi:hypothetical protein
VRRTRPCLEVLEDRLVLSPTISVANASVNEISNVSPFIASGSGGLSFLRDLVQGPDGNIYVTSGTTNSVIRYSPSGQLLGTFVAAGSGGLSNPWGLAFGPDGNLYVSGIGTDSIYEYSGSTGAFLSTFVAAGTGGLIQPTSLATGARRPSIAMKAPPDPTRASHCPPPGSRERTSWPLKAVASPALMS